MFTLGATFSVILPDSKLNGNRKKAVLFGSLPPIILKISLARCTASHHRQDCCGVITRTGAKLSAASQNNNR